MSKFTNSNNEIYRMMQALSKHSADEMSTLNNLGGIRDVQPLADTYVGLPLPESVDFVCFGTEDGVRRKYLVRGERLIYSTPAPNHA